MKQIQQLLLREKLTRIVTPVLAIVVVVSAGSYLIHSSFAATQARSFEAENGVLVTCASKVTDSVASNGSAVKFSSCGTASIKPALSGNMDRGGDWLNCIESSGQTPLPVASCFTQQVSAKPYVNAQTFEIDWSFIEPSNGTYNWQPIDDAITAVAGRGMRMRLKVQTGVYSADWVKNLGGTPVPFDNQNTYLTGDQTVPRFWTSQYKTAYQAFMTAMAARYDSSPTVAEVETCSAGLVSCETFLIQGNNKTSDGVTNAQHLYDAGLNDSLHMQAIQDDITFMATVWHKTRIQLTVQPFHLLGGCPAKCADTGGVPQITYDFIDGNHVTETADGGNVDVTGITTIIPNQAELFHTGLGPKEVGGTTAQPTGDPTTIGLYNYLYNQNGVQNRSNHAYVVPLQSETFGRLDVAWASALNYACTDGATAVELPHGYPGWEKLTGSWTFDYPTTHTDTDPVSVLNDANACYIHNASLH